MLVLVEIQHLNDQVILSEAQKELDDEMMKMGFMKVKALDAPNLRSVYYDVYDMRVGVRPQYLSDKIAQMNRRPDQCRLECKLIATKNMP
jgi:hypothetical protein